MIVIVCSSKVPGSLMMWCWLYKNASWSFVSRWLWTPNV